ncbi:hypothetical protein BDV95DRAFT_595355 [Massariosphaeria phaeospora]|uniref:Uncharacterized protein n=1 Tax=Massariosphaeria phaeospora TaxID=100035 RepID=A0A7C8M7A5_9PLEO|nr:hypothetical protein BDV95DRAFT_595355 [Massariosphaeria phaeospora]
MDDGHLDRTYYKKEELHPDDLDHEALMRESAPEIPEGLQRQRIRVDNYGLTSLSLPADDRSPELKPMSVPLNVWRHVHDQIVFTVNCPPGTEDFMARSRPGYPLTCQQAHEMDPGNEIILHLNRCDAKYWRTIMNNVGDARPITSERAHPAAKLTAHDRVIENVTSAVFEKGREEGLDFKPWREVEDYMARENEREKSYKRRSCQRLD